MEKDFSIWQEESTHAKILKQFNTPKSQGGFRCNGFEEFPKLLYMARPHPISGRYYVALEADELSLDRTRTLVEAQQFNRSCQLLVETPEMEERALRDGWRKSQAEAMEYREQFVEKQAIAAAERNYDDRRMSEKAAAEAKAIEEKIHGHVPEIPAQPTEKKPTDPAKVDRMAKARAAKAAKKAAAQGA